MANSTSEFLSFAEETSQDSKFLDSSLINY